MQCHSRLVVLLFALLLLSADAVQKSPSEPLEAPVVSATLSVRQESGGQCAEVRAGLRGRSPLIYMTDMCHGWSTQSCDAMLLIKGQGVTEDAAQVLFLRENRRADVISLVDAEIARIWPNNEHLHLALTEVKCGEGGLAVVFEGSRIPKGALGAAHGIKGTATFRSAEAVAVTIDPED